MMRHFYIGSFLILKVHTCAAGMSRRIAVDPLQPDAISPADNKLAPEKLEAALAFWDILEVKRKASPVYLVDRNPRKRC
jgi:hypothetical protein